MVAAPDFSEELLDRLRAEGDSAADDFITREFATPESKMRLYGWLKTATANQALAAVPEGYAQNGFICRSNVLPAWADAKLMQAGAAFFTKYAEQVMQLLGLLSLPYCYAAADGARVLHLSHRLKNDTLKRLTDTGEFIWSVLSPDAFTPQGKGFASCLTIRLTHAAARYYTKQTLDWGQGMPVNQEDMAGTNLAFSLLVIRGLRKLGYSVSYQEQHAYCHLWGVIGYLLGLTESLIPADGKTATALERRISERQFKASAHGRELTQALIKCFKAVSPGALPEKQVLALMRYLVGDQVSDLLGIPEAAVPSFLPGLLQLSANKPTLSSGLPVQAEYRKKYQLYRKGIEAQLPVLPLQTSRKPA